MYPPPGADNGQAFPQSGRALPGPSTRRLCRSASTGCRGSLLRRGRSKGVFLAQGGLNFACAPAKSSARRAGLQLTRGEGEDSDEVDEAPSSHLGSIETRRGVADAGAMPAKATGRMWAPASGGEDMKPAADEAPTPVARKS